MAEIVAISAWEKALLAAERVKERCRRASRTLDDAGLPYAVVGDNAVAEWVARIDDGAVRNTPDVDLLVRREDFTQVRTALENVGFVYLRRNDTDAFGDGPQDKPKAAVYLRYASEKVGPKDALASPDVNESERTREFQVVSLEALVRMKLVANRLKDKVHVRDMIGVGLIDATWPNRFPPVLAARLQQLLDDPNG